MFGNRGFVTLVLSVAVIVFSGCGGSNHAQVDAALGKQLADLSEKIDALSENVGSAPVEHNTSPSDDAAVVFHTTREANDFVNKLGKDPSAEKLADALATVDTWPVKSEQEKEMRQFKLQLASQLRKQVKEEVVALQKAALDADCGVKGATKHSETGRILALYPMSEDKAVVEEAKQLSAQQGEIAVRLEVIRRQRYNHWAAEQVEKAIFDYNSTKSRFPYRTDTDKLVEHLVENMGAVDPALLEPAVLELYNYAFDLTKAALSEQEKIDLAKKMTDPTLRRKILGDF